jgi:L-2-hydroxyglutarate oxidase
MRSSTDIVVVGAGLVGLATAHAIAASNSHVGITVLEAEAGPAQHQSRRNSGVLHSGVYYQPGSQKAAMCIDGARKMSAFCAEHDVAIEQTGKVIVATSPSEIDTLNDLETRGRANGLDSLEMVDEAGLREHEPHATGLQALFVPQAGVVDFGGVAERLVALLQDSGREVRTGFDVVAIERSGSQYRLTARSGEQMAAGYLINCAGLHSDRIARMAGTDPQVRIVPFRGEYYELSQQRSPLVRHLVYPVPDPRFPFLGVHFTRRIDGAVEVGPNAVLALGRHNYRGEGGVSFGDIREMATAPELWRLGARYWRTGGSELIRSRSRRLYAAEARKMIPGIGANDLRRGGSGIRAQAILPDGTLVDDFFIQRSDRAFHVLNAPSPAATACFAIGKSIAVQALSSMA